MGENGTRTAGTVEAWNLILKRSDHVKHRIRPDIFVMEHHDILIGKQRCYIDTLNIEKMKARLKVIVFSVSHY